MSNDKNIYVSPDISLTAGKGFKKESQKPHIKTLPKKSGIYRGPLNHEIRTLIDTYSQELILSKQNYTPIHVDEIASRLARFYEKIRKVIDWKDDNALRRGAIERVLKRILFPKLAGFSSKNNDPAALAETITIEITRSGHLPNHATPRERIKTLSIALCKYLSFLEYATNHKPFRVKQKSNIVTFILEIAACEIEEILTNPVKERGIIKAMAEILTKRTSVSPISSLTPKEQLRLFNISTQRTLYDLDDNYIVYQLLKEKYPYWRNPNPEHIKKLSEELPKIWENYYKEINTSVNRKFDVLAEKVDTVFMLLDDVLESLKDRPKEIVSILENKEELIKLVTQAYQQRYKTLKTRLLHLAVFSTLSVFLSNWVTFYLVEVPLAHLFYEGFNFFAATVDFLLPTFVMFLLVCIVKAPKKENLQKVVSTTLSFVYENEGQEHYRINLAERKITFFNVFLTVLYTVTAGLGFAGMAYVFYAAKLPMTSVIFDTFTIALTVFAAVVVRNQSRELNVDEDRSFQDFILDIITVPMAKVGSFLAGKWKEYNVVAIFFNFVIETPLAAVLDFIQGWNEYIKERRFELH